MGAEGPPPRSRHRRRLPRSAARIPLRGGSSGSRPAASRAAAAAPPLAERRAGSGGRGGGAPRRCPGQGRGGSGSASPAAVGARARDGPAPWPGAAAGRGLWGGRAERGRERSDGERAGCSAGPRRHAPLENCTITAACTPRGAAGSERDAATSRRLSRAARCRRLAGKHALDLTGKESPSDHSAQTAAERRCPEPAARGRLVLQRTAPPPRPNCPSAAADAPSELRPGRGCSCAYSAVVGVRTAVLKVCAQCCYGCVQNRYRCAYSSAIVVYGSAAARHPNSSSAHRDTECSRLAEFPSIPKVLQISCVPVLSCTATPAPH